MAVISIHAPAGGATRCPGRSSRGGIISIHAPAGGATHHGCRMCPNWQISIHAPAGGATAGMGFLSECGANFNPRSRRGSDEVSW